MIPYIYAAIQVRPRTPEADRVTVAVLAAALRTPDIALAVAPIRRLTRTDPAEVRVIRAAIDEIANTARHMASPNRTGRHASLVDWWRARSVHAEDFVRLCHPQPGATVDIHTEATRILQCITGLKPHPIRNQHARRVIGEVSRSAGLRGALRLETVSVDGLNLRFLHARYVGHTLVSLEPFDAHADTHSTRLLERAGQMLTRSTLLSRVGLRLRPVLVEIPPESPGLALAWTQTTRLLDEADAVRVKPDFTAIETALRAEGVGASLPPDPSHPSPTHPKPG